MSEEFIKNLECKKVESGDVSILEALSRFDCGNTDSPYHHVSSGMLRRFKQYISGKIDNLTDVYYIVWNRVDIFLFFSLQASLVFSTSIIKPEDIDKIKVGYRWASENNNEFQFTPDVDVFKEQLSSILDIIGCSSGIDGYTEDYEKTQKVISEIENIMECKKHDIQSNIYVERCIPSIEIVNFCKNQGLGEKWESAGLTTPVGATLFWFKILPIIEEVSKQIGCIYVSLFAADVSTDETDDKRKLLSYYEHALMFVKDEKLNALKPRYDWECIFLCQKISELCKRGESFKKTFLSGFAEDDV